VAVITCNRPEKLNALNQEMFAELTAAIDRVGADGAIRALVLTGAGRAFCAGADLHERRQMTETETRRQLSKYQASLGWLTRCPVPVVAALNGAALGGGLELALLCDFRVAMSGAVLGLPETSLAIIPGMGGTQRLPRLIGEARAKEMILLGRRLSAQEALEFGLVNLVCDHDLVETTIAWLRPILGGAPIAQAAALQAIREALSPPLPAGLVLERERYEECLGTEDRREALRAFAEKRAPGFLGR
jgi:enoyl-CoA hydratase/carnithine racemase